MKTLPRLDTERLILRAFTLADAPIVQSYVDHPLIAAMTGPSIQHPYPPGEAERWIRTHQENFEKNTQHIFAVTLRSNQEIVGCVGLYHDITNDKTEIGYWIAVDFWNRGYAVEASKAAIKYAFENIKTNKITARHATENPASGIVLQKIGMIKEGCLRQNFRKFGKIYDEDVYGLLRSEYKP